MDKKFRRKKYLADTYGISVRTVDRKIEWIRKHPDRYPADAVIHCGRIPFVREDVFQDAIANGNKIDAGLCPAFAQIRR
jgi:hypothetical protein